MWRRDGERATAEVVPFSPFLLLADPALVKYLYFVARGDGTHAFAETLDEHNRNVQKYQR